MKLIRFCFSDIPVHYTGRFISITGCGKESCKGVNCKRIILAEEFISILSGKFLIFVYKDLIPGNFLKMKIVFILICTVFSVTIIAQRSLSKFSLDLTPGISFPIGKFADEKYGGAGNNQPGLAKTGFALSTKVNYQLNQLFGVNLIVGVSFNKQGKNAFINFLQQGSNTVTGTVSSWSIYRIMPGIYYTGQIEKSKFSLLVSLSSGVCKAIVPKASFLIYSSNGTFSGNFIQYRTPYQWAFCYQAGIGFNYRINHQFYYNVNVNYFNSKPYKMYDNFKMTYNISSVNVQTGVGLNF